MSTTFMKTSFTDLVWILRWKWISENCTGIRKSCTGFTRINTENVYFCSFTANGHCETVSKAVSNSQWFYKSDLKIFSFKVKQKDCFEDNLPKFPKKWKMGF